MSVCQRLANYHQKKCAMPSLNCMIPVRLFVWSSRVRSSRAQLVVARITLMRQNVQAATQPSKVGHSSTGAREPKMNADDRCESAHLTAVQEEKHIGISVEPCVCTIWGKDDINVYGWT